MYYFKFQIPTNTDGSVVTYSPGWCGTRDRCAKGETGIYYNDKERWGIGIADDSFTPPDVEVVDAAKVVELMGIKDVVDKNAVLVMDSEGTLKADGIALSLPEITDEQVFYGKKLAERYLPVMETAGEKPEDSNPSEVDITRTLKESKSTFCTTCHQLVATILYYTDGTVGVVQGGKTVVSGIKTVNLVLSCPVGHKNKVVINGG